MSFKSLKRKTLPEKSKWGWLLINMTIEEQFAGIDVCNKPYTHKNGSITDCALSLVICGDCWKFENYAAGSGWGSGWSVEL